MSLFEAAQILVGTGVSLMVAILIAAMGELMVERAGIVNIGIEGMMLCGAFAAFAVCHATGSALLGVAAGVAAGATGAALFALLTVYGNADQIVTGLGLNLLALGITGVLHRGAFGTEALAQVQARFPYAAHVAVALVPAVWWLLYRTWWGLAIRAVGEHPRAADTVGINVKRLQAVCVVAGGALAGLAGCHLSIGYTNTFAENMTSGRGFVALAVVVFGKWHPVGAALGALLFGMAEALGVLLNTLGYHTAYQFFQMLPYVLTILVLAGLVGRATPPAHLAIPYRRE